MCNLSGRISVCILLTIFCGAALAEESRVGLTYEHASAGTRQFQWESDAGRAWIKVLVEASNLGSEGAEVGEVFFPPGYSGKPHNHELEILYVLEGELEHIVNGESHVLTPGMVGIVRSPDDVIHKAHSAKGVRVLVIWPLGNEVKGLQGMTETPLP